MSEGLAAVALASQSPRRRDLLESIGLTVTVIASDFDEKTQRWDREPQSLALRFARCKADGAVAGGPPIVIAADTLVVVAGEILGKPEGPQQAVEMLHKLSGREHVVHTGFSILNRASQQRQEGVESTRVRFMPLTSEQIRGYVATGDPLDKAGAYGIAGRGGLLVSRIEGDFYSVMGLPLARIGQALHELGYDLLAG